MGKLNHYFDSGTRQHLLQAALKCFAHRGYAGTSVQEIVDAAGVSKPVLYYYFADKAHLFQALVDAAHDDRYRLMREAVASTAKFPAQLLAILAALLEHLARDRELTRIGFATAFAAPGELPAGLQYFEKCERNFEFVHSLMKQALAEGWLDSAFTSEELAHGFYGQLNACLATHLLKPDCPPSAHAAEQVVRLFLQGAARTPGPGQGRSGGQRKQITSKITTRITKAIVSVRNGSSEATDLRVRHSFPGKNPRNSTREVPKPAAPPLG
jgi:TetR/AcrR family transcriptional regulator